MMVACGSETDAHRWVAQWVGGQLVGFQCSRCGHRVEEFGGLHERRVVFVDAPLVLVKPEEVAR